eukprot:CAMPEP_0177310198 /NCGR_PEP_ID=MMETSP0368-20130122/9712_1 /TAXON_ID=447022 ORGANISM="Scrippsiella hangoei-like, Strain SHHI-4" /NCGR_SAMPLE_ID=MMETSP0368 /ASSEMBLY_ACC=CAM_ASM_000363 /LENGTH=151 /DNA_ID=CAMNT_0018769143 /DNA_START=37 /DNA_END=488 /DNA_ORIENTATION=-
MVQTHWSELRTGKRGTGSKVAAAENAVRSCSGRNMTSAAFKKLFWSSSAVVSAEYMLVWLLGTWVVAREMRLLLKFMLTGSEQPSDISGQLKYSFDKDCLADIVKPLHVLWASMLASVMFHKSEEGGSRFSATALRSNPFAQKSSIASAML